MNRHQNEEWHEIITPQSSSFHLNFNWIFRYKDLLFLFVKRDFVAFYKQTVLGPLWFVIQPLLMTVTYVFLFGRVASLSSDGVPHTLFYLSGIVCWTYFSDSINQTSATFTKNAHLFGKVYFPRIITPVSIVITNLIKLGIQALLFFAILIYFRIMGSNAAPTLSIFLFPGLILIMALMGLGLGLIVSALTTKYRDLQFLIQFGVQLMMYASTVIFPLSSLEGKFRTIIILNPMSAIIETSRYMFLGSGSVPLFAMLYSATFSVIVFLLGVVIFNRTEKNFMDTV